MTPALVLTAGLATRLRPLSRVRAKAALPVAGIPLINRIVTWLAASGITECVLNLHHRPETITALTGDGAHLGVRIRYSWEALVLGSAGGPKRALPLLDAPRFLIVNGDTLTDLDMASLISAHRASGALVTMALVPNKEPGKYGGVVLENGGAVVRFANRNETTPTYHFIGVQVAEADAFAAVPSDVPYESVRELYPHLIRTRPGSVRGLVTTASFLDIGTPADYLRTSVRMAASHEGQRAVSARSRIAPSAVVEGSVLWDDVVVDADVRLRRCIVTDGVRVPAGTSWTDVTIRLPGGELDDHEEQIDGLVVGPVR